jgi:hypothetical protein
MPKKSPKKREGNRRHHLKKTVPTGSNVYLCICIFSKEITVLPPPPTTTTTTLTLINLALTLALPWTRIGWRGGGCAVMRLISCHHKEDPLIKEIKALNKQQMKAPTMYIKMMQQLAGVH